ncbi:uncharacterized protein LOC131666394 [Phymastichus coffea]|uniref:uncharacterized protein LOC131666394 n=1 Tax=Phymastichus coffea TaxID=108790 RepID=UPI00273C35D0|nr:uncharacterized protein LOC131666394 [Phymastichus coffea]
MFLKVIVIYLALLCTYVLGTSESLQFVEKLNERTTNSSTFWFLYRLYTVKKNDSHIEISKTNENYEKAEIQCTAKLYPVKDQIAGRIRVVPGVYTLLVYGVVDTKVVDQTRKTYYKALVIDHINCTYNTISLPLQEVPVDYQILPPLVQNNLYDFDFFYPNKECSPCQIFENAGYIMPKHQLKLDTEKPSKAMLLKKARWPKKSPYGYFYAYNFANKTAVIRFLSKEYEIIKEKFVGHPIDAADASYSPTDDRTYIVFCYGNGTQEVYCSQYDDDLMIRLAYAIPLDAETYISGVTVKVDKRGHSMIALVRSPLKQRDKTHRVSSFIYDSEAKLRAGSYVAELDCEYRHFDLASWFYDYGRRQEYCIHIAGRKTIESTDAHDIVKCLFWNEVHEILY